jgi:hypothetical protein
VIRKTGDSSPALIATQDILPLVKARRETSEEEYMAFMRPQFQFQPGARPEQKAGADTR